MQSHKQLNLAEEAALRGAAWALVGSIFGFLFIVLAEWLQGRLDGAYGLAVATIGAGALTSLFYGSMRLTVMVANFTFIAMLVYTWQGPSTLALEPLVFIGAGVGLAVGAAYGLKDKRSRVFCAEAKIIAGAIAGLVGGGLLLLLNLLVDGLSNAALAAVVAPVAVLSYIVVVGWFISRCHHLLPAVVDGIVVGLGVGSVTGLLFLIMAGTLDEGLIATAALQDYVYRVESSWGITVIACAAACAPVGVVRAVLRLPWYDK